MNNTKTCHICQQEKEFNQFCKSKSGKFGLHNTCRECQKTYHKNWNLKNKERESKKHKTPEYKEKKNARKRERYNNDPEYRERLLKINKTSRAKESSKITIRKYEKMKLETDINYKLSKILRKRVRYAINKIKLELNIEVSKCVSTIDLVGCSIIELKIYIENQFLPGMTWENHGRDKDKWHIDHVLPCELFDMTDPKQQLICFNYKNLKPLWEEQNISKHDKLPNGRFARDLSKIEKLEYLKELGYDLS